METKTCKECKKELPATTDFFYKHPSTRDLLYTKCKKCHAEYLKNYREKNRSELLKYSKEYVEKNKARIKAYQREYRIKNKERLKAKRLTRLSVIREEQS